MKRFTILITLTIMGILLVSVSPWVIGQDSQSQTAALESATAEAAASESVGGATPIEQPRRGMRRMQEPGDGPVGGPGMGRGGMGMGRGGRLGPQDFGPEGGLGPGPRGGLLRGFGLFGRGPGRPERPDDRREMREAIRGQMESPDRMREIRRENPELADAIEKLQRVRYKIDLAASQAPELSSDADKTRFKKRLQPLLEEEFELDMQRQDMEIQLMENRLKRLREVLDKRKEYRSRIIEMKADQLILNPPRTPSEPEPVPEPVSPVER